MPSLRRIALSLLLATLPALTACKEGINERCQVDSDCRSDLQCVLPAGGNVQEGGTCQPRGTVDATVPRDASAGDGGATDQGTEGGVG
ncbi:MAG TPA: hypothetical protein VH877_20635 [Polyangia bacterium]|jgi:hypothetical protein|nr:hypothetical protein [Polyangia bacterium]